jgi:hypothetical protein
MALSIMILVFPFLSVLNHKVQAAEGPLDLPKRPMDFALVQDGDCSQSCVQWISAEGRITEETPRLFERLLKRLNGRKLPVVIQSAGGDVDAALAIGHMIRTAGLETDIGRTQLDNCPMLDPRCPEKTVKDGWSAGKARAGSAYCFSACPFLFAGGFPRAAAINVYIGVHQITMVHRSATRGKSDRRTVRETTSTTLSSALREKLAGYFREMGISQNIFVMMALAKPDEMYHVPREERETSGLITKVYTDDEDPGMLICGAHAQAEARCHVVDEATIQNVAGGVSTKDAATETADRSCDEVEHAYEAFRNSDSFVTKIYQVSPNAGPRLHLEWQRIQGNSFIRVDNGLWRREASRANPGTDDQKDSRATFSDCRLQDSEDLHGEPTKRYAARWERNGWVATVHVWIGNQSGKFVKVISQYKDGHAEFDFPVALQTISYGQQVIFDAEEP